MRMPASPGASASPEFALEDVLAFKELPAIRSFFLDTRYEGGVVEREPGVMILCVRGGRWWVTLKEPTSCKMVRFSAETLDGLWLSMEAVLGGDSTVWELDTYETEKKKNVKRRR